MTAAARGMSVCTALTIGELLRLCGVTTEDEVTNALCNSLGRGCLGADVNAKAVGVE